MSENDGSTVTADQLVSVLPEVVSAARALGLRVYYRDDGSSEFVEKLPSSGTCRWIYGPYMLSRDYTRFRETLDTLEILVG